MLRRSILVWCISAASPVLLLKAEIKLDIPSLCGSPHHMNLVLKCSRPNQFLQDDMDTSDHNICGFSAMAQKKSIEILQLSAEQAAENNAWEAEHKHLFLNCTLTLPCCHKIHQEQTWRTLLRTQTKFILRSFIMHYLVFIEVSLFQQIKPSKLSQVWDHLNPFWNGKQQGSLIHTVLSTVTIYFYWTNITLRSNDIFVKKIQTHFTFFFFPSRQINYSFNLYLERKRWRIVLMWH